MSDDRAMAERRRFPRLPAAWPVEIAVERATIVGQTIDVSEYGLFIATAPTTALKVGQSYRVQILVSLANPFTVEAEVRHVGERGAGMETRERLPIDLTERARGAL
jgi:hypothetical protein